MPKITTNINKGASMICRVAISKSQPFPVILKFTDIRSYILTAVFVLLSVLTPWLFHQFHNLRHLYENTMKKTKNPIVSLISNCYIIMEEQIDYFKNLESAFFYPN